MFDLLNHRNTKTQRKNKVRGKFLCFFCVSVSLWFFSEKVAPAAPHPNLPDGPIPSGLGINIHFTEALPGEMEMLAATGAKWIRMDWGWGRTEREKGVYDWTEPDKLVASLEKHNLRAIFILSYGNKLYSPVSPATPESRAAFARWAVAAVNRYKGRGIVWEMWNEPNLFWTPKINAEDYVQLALTASEAIKKAAPDEALIGPALARTEFDYLEKVFAGGVLKNFDAVSVHPYRNTAPDSVVPDYARLRNLIQKYAPEGKDIPIVISEWGYSSSTDRLTETQQARTLSRMWLTNLGEGIPLSIWYDWRDDGDNPNNSEHRYGLVRRPYLENQTPVFEPKPAYFAAQDLIRELEGFQFETRISTGDERDRVLVFARGNERKIAAWTSVGAGRIVRVASPFARGEVTLPLSPAPIYVAPLSENRSP